jgi:hypothetical protein
MHNLENLIKIYSINGVENYITAISENKDLEDKISCCDNLFPYDWSMVQNEFNSIINSFLETIDKSNYSLGDLWGNIIKPNQEIGAHINTENGYDVIDNTDTYVGILNLKYISSVHKGTYFADNSLRVNEYKPILSAGDLAIFPGNIYHRIPLNASDENIVILTLMFTVS